MPVLRAWSLELRAWGFPHGAFREPQTAEKKRRNRSERPPEVHLPRGGFSGIRDKLRRRIRRAVQLRDKISDSSSSDKPEPKTELEDACAAPANLRRQGLGKIHRHDDGHVSSTHSLEDSPEKHRPKRLFRKADSRNSHEEERSRSDNHAFPAEPLGKHPRRKR